MKKCRKTISLMLSLFLLMMSITAFPVSAAGTIAVNSPVNGSEISAGSVDFSVTATDIKNLVFYLDDAEFATFTDIAVDDVYSAQTDVVAGHREFKAVATYSDDETETVYSYFNATTAGQVGIDSVPAGVETFDSLTLPNYANRTSDPEVISAFTQQYGWSISSLDGTYLFKTSHNGGSAIGVGRTKTGAITFKLDGWTNEVTSGTVVVEYDFFFNPVESGKSGQLCMIGLPFDGEYGVMIAEGTTTIKGTDFAPGGEKWHHMCYEYNVDNNTISLKIDGTPYWTDKQCSPKAGDCRVNQLYFDIGFWSSSNYFLQNNWAYFALDNFSLYKKSEVKVESKSFEAYGSLLPYENEVPDNATSVAMKLSSDIGSVSASELSVAVNGAKVTTPSYNYSNNTLKVSVPSGIKADDTITVTLDTDKLDDTVTESYKVGKSILPTCDIVSPLNGEKTLENQGKISLSAKVTNATEIKFYIDDACVKTFTDRAPDAIYKYDFDSNALSLGNHIFKVESTTESGDTLSDIAKFELCKQFIAPVNSGVSTETETFESLSVPAYGARSKDASVCAQQIAGFEEDFGWTISEHDGTYLYKGSHNGGSALGVGRRKTGSIGLRLDGWTEEVKSGTIVIDYDFYFNPVDAAKGGQLCMLGIPFDGRWGTLIAENSTVIKGTDFAPGGEVWHNMHYEYNVDDNTISLDIDGTPYWVNKACDPKEGDCMADQLYFDIGFWSGSTWFLENDYAYFALDNFRIYKLVDTGASAKSVFGNLTVDSDNAIAEGADAVELAFGCEFDDLSAEDFAIAVNGAEKNISSFAADANNVKLGLPEGINAGDDVKVTLKNPAVDGASLGRDIELDYTVVENDNKLEIKTANDNVVENSFSCDVILNNPTKNEVGMNIIAASYKDGKMLKVNLIKDVTAKIGSDTINASVDCSGADSVRVFAFDSIGNLVPLCTAKTFDIN